MTRFVFHTHMYTHQYGTKWRLQPWFRTLPIQASLEKNAGCRLSDSLIVTVSTQQINHTIGTLLYLENRVSAKSNIAMSLPVGNARFGHVPFSVPLCEYDGWFSDANATPREHSNANVQAYRSTRAIQAMEVSKVRCARWTRQDKCKSCNRHRLVQWLQRLH